ncbi:cation:dicarboxylate symporter family transporter [Holdemanella biformis]
MAGIPTNQILGVYISVNTLCDMGATCVNVIGDLACSTVLKQTLHFKKKK